MLHFVREDLKKGCEMAEYQYYGQPISQPGEGSAPQEPIQQEPAVHDGMPIDVQPIAAESEKQAAEAQSGKPSKAVKKAQKQVEKAQKQAEKAQKKDAKAQQKAAAKSAPAPAPAAAAPKKSGGGFKTFLFGFLGALVACILAFVCAGSFFSFSDKFLGAGNDVTVIEDNSNSTVTIKSEDVTLPEVVADKALPSVACINVYVKKSSLTGGMNTFTWGYGNGFSFDSGQDDSDEMVQYSLGSGVVLTADGYLITNYHVIQNGEQFKVMVDGGEYEADVIGTDTSSDLAVLKCRDASNLTPISIGDSDSLKTGEWVMSIGCPFGLEQSVATGIVSATSRSQILASSSSGESAAVYTNLIQTDAAINPGNSGGALVNDNGELIGINTLIESYSGNYSGVGFAIPSNYACSIAKTIINGGTPTHALMGVIPYTLDSATAKRYDLGVEYGAYVQDVTRGSGAAKAGLKVGDIIVSIDDEKIESSSDLVIAVRSHNVGDTVQVEFYRDKELQTVEVTLGSDS